ncbi:2-oxo acid dehydrogenase subunit E2 [Streptomyces sp. NPDC090057]|uniref:2-oxo acid dehydrogenase subunit E2 n=1 Tax=Streptomyces sp. NPDC090057 TaxID=3365935 RepID=UPI0037F71A64
MTAFTMPSLGADMDEGVLREWLVSPGDPVRRGDVVAVVETDKAAIEVECFESGTVGRLLVEPGTRVPVGTPLALIEGAAPAERAAESAGRAAESAGRAAESAGRAAESAGRAEAHEKRPATTKAAERPEAHDKQPATTKAAKPAGQAEAHEKQPATTKAAEPAVRVLRPPGPAPAEPSAAAVTAGGAGPLVRHLAVLRGVDLATVHGSGPGGRITRADVEHAPPPRAPGVRATPYARRLAHDLGVDLTTVRGTGEGGAVRAADVRTALRTSAGGRTGAGERAGSGGRAGTGERAGAQGRTGAGERAGVGGTEAERSGRRPRDGERRPDAAAPAAGRPEGRTDAARTDAMRRAIADLMSRSKREIPHYYLSTTIDLTAAADWLRRVNRDRPPAGRLVPAALLLKAAAAAAREVPALNGHWRDDGFVPGAEVNLGIAVSLRQGGLLAPVIHRADTLSPQDLMARLKDLVQRARRGRLRGSETSGATLTVTSLGEQGVEAVFGVIHPPQVALVGFGAVVERPWAAGGMLGVRPVVTATLAADHRATDGAVGARYLTAVGRLLQGPEEL